jgi:tRNA G18 (ribose-2'-O)-methylase SpoU
MILLSQLMIIAHITDPSDPRISIYRDLKDKDLRRDNAFIVEGKFILETVLTQSRFKISSILITQDRILPLQSLLSQVPAGIPVYVTTAAIMAAIAGYDVHRGILAAGIASSENTKAEYSLPAYVRQFRNIAVVSGVANPDNIGAIFRNAAGLGVEAVLLDAKCCNPLYRKAIRVSMGATLVLPWHQSSTIEQLVDELLSAGFSIYALSLQGAAKLEDVKFEKLSAFLFGEEAYGLPATIQQKCKAVTIPMAQGTDSLNVAATSAIVFDAARRQRT